MAQWSHSDLSVIANAPPCGHTPGADDIPRPMGCVRSDGVNSVVYSGRDDGHIHQLHLSGNRWIHSDLSLQANATDSFLAAVNSPTSCVRPDNVFSVVYIGRDNHIHALQLAGGATSQVDLSALTSAPGTNRVGPLAHFVRADGIPVVIYVGITPPGPNDATTHFHVDQLALSAGKWTHSDLSAATHTSDSGSILLHSVGYVKPGKIAAVICGEGAPVELVLSADGSWQKNDLFSSVQIPRPSGFHFPMGFVKADGTASVVYFVDGTIHELSFVADGLVATDLSAASRAPTAFASQATGPMGYVRGDGVTAVVYRSQDRMHELAFVDGRWLHTDLSQAAGIPTDAGYPFAYVRSDRISSVVYSGADGHIHELALQP
jgi:hypothetical protein